MVHLARVGPMRAEAHGGPPSGVLTFCSILDFPENKPIWPKIILTHSIYAARILDPSGTKRDIFEPFRNFPKPNSEYPSLFILYRSHIQ
jgi:hypothetical protein